MKIYDNPEFDALAPEVRRLFAAGPSDSFFNLPEWYRLVAVHGLEPGWGIRVYAADEAALIARVRTVGRRSEIHSACNMYSIDHAILSADSGQVPNAAVRDLASDIARNSPGLHTILLSGLDRENSGFAASLAGFGDAGFVTAPYRSWPIWYEPTRGLSFEDYLARRPSVLVNTWRRKRAALEKSSRLAITTYGAADLGDFISHYSDVYRRSWKPEEPFPAFMPALIHMAAGKGALRAGVLHLDGQPVAAQFWIVWAGRAVIYKLAYDENTKKQSPGTLLTMHMARHVLEGDHPFEINFGRGDDPYKQLWMSERRECWGIEARNPRTLRGLAAGIGLRLRAARDRLVPRNPQP